MDLFPEERGIQAPCQAPQPLDSTQEKHMALKTNGDYVQEHHKTAENGKTLFFFNHQCSRFLLIYSLLFLLIFIGVQLLYNVVLVSAVQPSESVIHIHISPLFWISFPFRSPQSTEQSSLCYAVGSHQLSILYIVVYIYMSIPISQFIPPTPSPLITIIRSLDLCLYFCFANKFIGTIFLDSTCK